MPSPKGPPELKHLDRILVTPTAIRRRIAALGQQLNRDYAKKDLMVVAIVNGALIFTADLLRQMRSPLRLDCLRASSYHDGTKAVHEPRIFDLWLTRARKSPRTRNWSHWRCNSYAP